MTNNNGPDIRVVAAVVATALFMENIDSTAVVAALPSMALDLGVAPVHLSTIITAYLVALTASIPVSGWIADKFGAKNVFIAALGVFSAASVCSAMSEGLPQMLVARIFQGVSAAMMLPVGRLLLFKRAQRHELLAASTWLFMPALIGPVIGPAVGGIMTDTFGWRSVFWINVPFGVLGMFMAWRLIPTPEPEQPQALDLKGALLLALSLSSIMIGMETLGRGLLPAWLPPVVTVSGLALLWMAIRHCKRVPAPAVDMSLFSIPTFRVSALAGGLFRLGAGALPFLAPLSLQLVLGMSATQAGLITLASALGSFAMRPLTEHALARFSARAVLVTSSASFAAALLACAFISSAWPAAALFSLLLFSGLSRSLGFATMGALVYCDVPQNKMSAATSLQTTAMQLCRAAGVAISACILQLSMALDGRKNVSGWDFAIAFTVIACIVVASAPVFARLPKEAGEGLVPKAPRAS